MNDLEARIAGFVQATEEAAKRSAVAAEAYGGVVNELEHLREQVAQFEAETLTELRAERTAREIAERLQDRFRYALSVYLQERDRQSGEFAGIHAPTPETLKLIRELVAELEPRQEQ